MCMSVFIFMFRNPPMPDEVTAEQESMRPL
jgi:hypothetical protein